MRLVLPETEPDEARLELQAVPFLSAFRDQDLFRKLKHKPHTSTLSRVVNAEIAKYPAPQMRLAPEVTERVLEKLAGLKSFSLVLSDPEFPGLLEAYVSRQLLLAKCKRGMVVSPEAQKAALVLILARRAETGLASGINRAAREMVQAGLSAKEIVDVLSGILRAHLADILGGEAGLAGEEPKALPG